MIQEYGELASQLERPANIPDSRIAAALFFVNGLTSTKLSTLELGTLAELSRLTKVIVVIAKADCLLPQELAFVKAKVWVLRSSNFHNLRFINNLRIPILTCSPR